LIPVLEATKYMSTAIANELRKDYLLDRWVVIATQRKKRPTDFVTPAEKRQEGTCAFDPGNEHMTPPAILVYLPKNGGILKDKDENDVRPSNWLIRIVPNLYPALSPPEKEEVKMEKNGFVVHRATGHHEVIIESPKHNEHLGVARVSQIVHVVNAYIERFHDLSSKTYVKYVSIFRNHGLEAGASLSHAHTQVIATPFVPKTLKEELKASQSAFKKNKKCIFCDITQKESQSARFIWGNRDFTVFAPWASIHPFEFWVFPKKHQCCLLDLSHDEVESLAKTIRVSLGGLNNLLNDPPYNFGFHQLCSSESKHYHWHLEVYPRLSIWAGFEKSTGMYINVVSPEDAAKHLQEAVLAEEASLTGKD
jgi:UDPglucose--hexose-1-phosphate uridylyltransferase